MNFTAPFFRHASDHPERVAIIYKDSPISYGELARHIHRFANALREAGVAPGDRIALMMNNRPEFVIPYYATVAIGAIVVPMNTFLVGSELAYQLRDVEAKVFVCNEWRIEEFLAMREQIPSIRHVIATGQYEGATPVSEFSAGQPEEGEIHDTRLDDVALIRYTSGTTGKPKGAMQTHGNVLRFLEVNRQVYPLSPEDRPLLFVPLFHGFGDHCCLNLTLFSGAGLVLMDPFRPAEIFSAIQRYRCNYFGAPPSMLYGLMVHPEADRYDLSSLQRVLTGGGPVSREIADGFREKFGVPVLQGYGLSEGTAGYTYTRVDMAFREGSCGVPLPGVEIRIVDDQGREVPVGETGEIVVKSEFNMKGYWNNPAATAETLRDGWLHTGDVGKVDEEGYLYIVDRKKEVIIMSGENIYPSEVEDVLLTHPGVQEVAVIGEPEPRRGEIPVAVIVPREGTRTNPQELIDYCKERMASFKVPRRIVFRDALPKGPTFKVLRRKLKEELYGTPP